MPKKQTPEEAARAGFEKKQELIKAKAKKPAKKTPAAVRRKGKK